MLKTLFFSFLDIFLTIAVCANLRASSFPQLKNPAPILAQNSSSNNLLANIEKKKIWPHAAVLRNLSNCWKSSCWPWKSSPAEIQTEKKSLKRYSAIPKMTQRTQKKIQSRLKAMGSRYPNDLLLVSPSTQNPASIAQRTKILKQFDQEQIKLIRRYWPNWKDSANSNSSAVFGGGGGGGAAGGKKKNKKSGISGGAGGGGGGGGGSSGGGSGGGGGSPPGASGSPAMSEAQALKNSVPKTAAVPSPPKSSSKPVPKPQKAPAPKSAKTVKKIKRAPPPIKTAQKPAISQKTKAKSPLLKPQPKALLSSHPKKTIPVPEPNKKSSQSHPNLKKGIAPVSPFSPLNKPQAFQEAPSPSRRISRPTKKTPPKSLKNVAIAKTNSAISKEYSYPQNNSKTRESEAQTPDSKSKPLPLDQAPPSAKIFPKGARNARPSALTARSKKSDIPVFLIASSLTSLAALILMLWFL